MCEGICGLDGVCFTPPVGRLYGTGQSVKDAKQCYSGYAYAETTLTRPSLLEPGRNVNVQDLACSSSSLGQGCGQSSDCSQLICSSAGRCELSATGASCAMSSDCKSNACTAGVCGLSTGNMACSSSVECFSNNCDAKTKKCGAVGNQGSCRVDAFADCGRGSSCDADGKCRYSYGAKRSSGAVCSGGSCVGGDCHGTASAP
ncbi:hypothetical protein V8E36_005801 [Tilletia maclaganii]